MSECLSDSIKQHLLALFQAAVNAAQADQCLPDYLPKPAEQGRTVVIGAGKAAAAMAQTLERHWDQDLSGLVVTRYQHGLPCERIQVVEAAHPVPDQTAAAEAILEQVKDLNEDDVVLALISGGGSALLTLPAEGISLADKQAVNRALLASGAPISVMNKIRQQLSAIKGGKLAQAAHPAKIYTFIISDVPQDDPSFVASGPTIPTHNHWADIQSSLEEYQIQLPPTVMEYLANAQHQFSDLSSDPYFARDEICIIATPSMALHKAAELGQRYGYQVHNLGADLEGEAREVAKAHAKLAQQSAHNTLILSGGELTVTLKHAGRGGPNAEYCLALAIALEGQAGIYALACDTDGIDGSEDNAGAMIDPTTLSRARAAGLDPQQYLLQNNAYAFFEALGDLVMTGPTRTNVNDFRAIIIQKMGNFEVCSS